MKRLALAALFACNASVALGPKTACAPSQIETLVPRSKAPADLPMLQSVAPVYPPAAQAREITGWVDVEFTIGSDGLTCDVKVVASEPPAVFDRSALQSVSQWQFATMSAQGQPVAVAGVRKRVMFGMPPPDSKKGELPQVACQSEQMIPLMPVGPAQENRQPYAHSMPTGVSDTRASRGWVDLEYSVNTLGAVCDARVVAAEPAGAFERTSLKALLQWKYRPVLNSDGQPMASSGMRYRMDFK